MEISPACIDIIDNPLLKNTSEVLVDDELIEINQFNVSKYFQRVYVLCPFKNISIDKVIFNRLIDKKVWASFNSKLVLFETVIKILKNYDHYNNLCYVNSGDVEQFNYFGYELDEKILVIPILNISYLNIQNYVKLFEGHYTLKDLYNMILIANEEFRKSETNLSFNSVMYITDIIKNLDESNYWTRQYNCLMNISQDFNNRVFHFDSSRLKNKELVSIIEELKTINIGYFTKTFNYKSFVDASNTIKKKGYSLYRISKPDIITKKDMHNMFLRLNFAQQYYLFFNLLISKKYCHLVINNKDVLDIVKPITDKFADLYRYLLGYAWVRFYLEESIKKIWINKNDEFIFDIDTASRLPVFPFILENPKLNPYIPLFVNDKYLKHNNIGGFVFYNTNNTKYVNEGIVDLQGFKTRFNLFITGNSQNNIFNQVDWKNEEIAVTGSIMTACLQKRHPLLSKFEGKNNFENISDFDGDWSRYFNEYYPESDIDIMVRCKNSLEFIKKVKNIYNQIVVNICSFNPINVEPNHIRITIVKSIFIFVTEDFINENIVSEEFTFKHILDNLEDDAVIKLFQPYFENKINEFYKKDFLTESNEFKNIKEIQNIHPELFDENVKKYQIIVKNIRKNNKCKTEKASELDENIIDNLLEEENFVGDFEIFNDMSEYKDININISYKAKVQSQHINHPLEFFIANGDDFFSLVSKFHLPCVRAYYDGDNVYMTPSCVTAHLTYMNIDYKYFSGSNDPISIILKNRMRGFGTFLNVKEINQLLKYIAKVNKWNNLYNVDLKNKNAIKSIVGSLNYDDKVFHPRLFNYDYYGPEISYVNINDGYNNIPVQKVLESSNVNEYLNLKFDIDNINYELINFTTISPAGFLNPVEKWLIESTFNSKKNSKKVNDNNKFFRGRKYDKYTFLKKETLIEEQIENV